MHPANFRHHIPTNLSESVMTTISGSLSHFDHFDATPMEIVHDYHINLDYWNTAYKNGSTPMKEMEGRRALRLSRRYYKKL